MSIEEQLHSMEMGTNQQEEAAFRLVIAHRSMLKGYINGMIRDPDLAEDTFSDTILAIVRSWDRFDSQKAFGNWARGIAHNVAMENLRREQRQRRLLDELVLDLVGEELEGMGEEGYLSRRQAALNRCLEKLSSANQCLIRLRYFEKRSYQEIADALGRNMGAIYTLFSRLHRALSQCVARQKDLL